jgi:hypothetical protein
MKKIIDEMLEALASALSEDGAFEKFKEEVLKDKGFVEFLKQKEEKECNCVSCQLRKQTIKNFEENIMILIKSGALDKGFKNVNENLKDDELKFAAEMLDEKKKDLEKAIESYLACYLASHIKNEKEN